MKCEIKVGMLLLEDVICNGMLVLQMSSNNLRQIKKKPATSKHNFSMADVKKKNYVLILCFFFISFTMDARAEAT